MGAKIPRPRKTLDALKLSGTYQKNKGRYAGRNEPDDKRPIGRPYGWLSPAAQAAWRELVPNLPWLRYSHRGIVGITAIQIAKMMPGELGIPGMNLLRQCLGQLGATPADAHRAAAEMQSDEDVLGAEYIR